MDSDFPNCYYFCFCPTFSQTAPTSDLRPLQKLPLHGPLSFKGTTRADKRVPIAPAPSQCKTLLCVHRQERRKKRNCTVFNIGSWNRGASKMDIDDLLAEVAVDSTPQESRDLRELTRCWVAERVAPEILPWPTDLMARVLERIGKQVSPGGHNSRRLAQRQNKKQLPIPRTDK